MVVDDHDKLCERARSEREITRSSGTLTRVDWEDIVEIAEHITTVGREAGLFAEAAR
jgi:hypothetical protein